MFFRGSRDTNKVFRERFFSQFRKCETETFKGTQRLFPPKCIEKSFWAIQSTLRSLEMHSKERYKVCTYLFGHPRKA